MAPVFIKLSEVICQCNFVKSVNEGLVNCRVEVWRGGKLN